MNRIRIGLIACISILVTIIFSHRALGQSQSASSASPAVLLQQADSLKYVARYDSSSSLYQKAMSRVEATKDWTKVADILYKLSQNSTKQDKLDRAASYLDNAFDLLQQHNINDSSLQIKILQQKGVIALERAEYESALRHLRKGLELAEPTDQYIRLAVLLNTSIADVLEQQGKYQQSIEQLAKTEELYHRHRLDDRRLLSSIYNSFGIAYQQNGNYTKSLQYYRQSLDIDTELLPDHHPELAKTFNNIAIIHYHQGDYQQALDYIKNAVAVLRNRHGKNHSLVAAGYNNIGIVYSEMDRLEEAADYLKLSLDIKETILGEMHPDIAIGYQNLGAIFYDLGEYEVAIDHYERSETIHKNNFQDGHPELANVYANMGQAYAQIGQTDRALDYYQKDLRLNKELLYDEHPVLGDTYTKLGETYALSGNYNTALSHLQQAINIYVEDLEIDQFPQSFSVEKVTYPAQLMETLKVKADILLQYFNKSGDLHLLEQRLQTCLRAARVIGKLQQSYSRSNSKFLLREQYFDLFQSGISTAYQLFQKTSEPDYKEYAFYFAEKGTHQILAEQLKKINARQFSGVPDTLIDRGRFLRAQITDLQQELVDVTSSTRHNDSLKQFSLRDSLFHLRQEFENHVQQLENNYPKYYKLKHRLIVVRAGKIQQDLLSPDQTMLRYFLGTDALYVFVISKDQFILRKIAAGPSLNQEIEDYRKLLVDNSESALFAPKSYELYSRLIEPVSDFLSGKQLLIVPDGKLHYLPFESLLTQKEPNTDQPRFHNYPYLLHDYVISYAPSADLLHLNNQDISPSEGASFLGLAPTFSWLSQKEKERYYPDFSRSLAPLPFSKREVTQIKKLFTEKNTFDSTVDGQTLALADTAATETAFKNMPLEEFRFIHLATHAFVSEEEPKRSGILFAPPQGNREDGTLYASEIYNLSLNAQLVTLSACKTGMGKIVRGEGVMSISRAFQYAGAKNLLVSLWNIDDRSTAHLMGDIYQYYQQEASMSRAIQRAKQKMIEGVEYAHPKYWAPFIFINQ